MNPADNRSMREEELRRQWRDRLMRDPAGLAWLVGQVKQTKPRVPEKDLGPHRTDAPVPTIQTPKPSLWIRGLGV